MTTLQNLLWLGGLVGNIELLRQSLEAHDQTRCWYDKNVVAPIYLVIIFGFLLYDSYPF